MALSIRPVLGLLIVVACSDPTQGGPSASGGTVGHGATSASSGSASGGTIASGGSPPAEGAATSGAAPGGTTSGGATPGGTNSTGGLTRGASSGNGGANNGGARTGGAGGAFGAGNGGTTSGGAAGSSSGAGGINGGTGGTGGQSGAGQAGAGTSPAAAIDKFRFECPCKPSAADHTSNGNCNVTPQTDRQTIMKRMGGDATKVYNVTLRVRGLTEPNTYKNGTLQGERFYIGGTTNTPGYTSYMMTVADPAQHYFFNHSPTTGHVHFTLDYQVTVKIRGGTQVTFDVDGDGSVPDGHQVANFDQMVVPGVPPAPDWYDGQFVQLDVVSVEVAQ